MRRQSLQVTNNYCLYFYISYADVLTVIPVFTSSRRLSWIVQTALILSVLGVTLFLFIPVGLHKHVNDGSYLVKSGLGNSGWNAGTAWILAIGNSMYAFGGTDGGKAFVSKSLAIIINARKSYPYQ